VYDTALLVPLILTEELQSVTLVDVLNPGRKIYVVGDKYRLRVADAENDPLVANPVNIVFEHFLNQTRPFDLQIALPVFKRRSELCRISCGPASTKPEIALLVEAGKNQNDQQDV
jgi:hypothetical protein